MILSYLTKTPLYTDTYSIALSLCPPLQVVISTIGDVGYTYCPQSTVIPTAENTLTYLFVCKFFNSSTEIQVPNSRVVLHPIQL
jgi:hypothetical protein